MNEMNDMELKEQVEKGLKQTKPKKRTDATNGNVTQLFGSPENHNSIHINDVKIGNLQIKNYKPTFIYQTKPEPESPKVSQHQASKVLHLVESVAKWEERINIHPKSYTQVCTELKKKFKFSEYETILAEQFNDVVSYLEILIGRLANEFINKNI